MTHSRPHTKTGFAVVGCGYWGPNFVRNLLKMDDIALKSVCDLDPNRLEALEEMFPGLNYALNLESILADDEIEAVIIASPLSTHYDLAKRCLTAGKHVLLEKPMAPTLKECLDLVEIASKHGKILMTGHLTLFTSELRKIKDILDSGDLGEIYAIRSRRLSLGLFRKDHNVMWDLAPHDIASILYLTGKIPKSVHCVGKSFVTPGIEDITTLTLDFDSQQVTIESSWLDPHKVRTMTLVGSKGMIAYDDCAPTEKVRIYDKRVETPPHWNSMEEFSYAYHYGDVHSPHIPWVEPLATECRNFIDSIHLGQKPLVDGLDGARVIAILEAASESLKQGGVPIDVPPFLHNSQH